MYDLPRPRLGRTLLIGLAVTGTLSAALGSGNTAGAHFSAAHSARGTYVYTVSNTAANKVIGFRSDRTGLHEIGQFATGGAGTGASLGSQGAIAVTPDGRRLLAVNAASNTVSLFQIRDGGALKLEDIAPTGPDPISVTAGDGNVFVLNAGNNTVSGLQLRDDGLRTSGATTALSAGAAAPAQVELSPRADRLVVTEKASSTVDSFRVAEDGALSGLTTIADAAATTPFGFDFSRNGDAIVSNAAGAKAGASTVDSFNVSGPSIRRIGTAVADTQTAACWVVTDRDAGRAYVANAASDSISLYSVAVDGSLTLRQAVAATTTGKPLDEAIAGGNLYVLLGPGAIGRLSILPSGALGTPVTTPAAGFSGSAAGIVAVDRP